MNAISEWIFVWDSKKDLPLLKNKTIVRNYIHVHIACYVQA